MNTSQWVFIRHFLFSLILGALLLPLEISAGMYGYCPCGGAGSSECTIGGWWCGFDEQMEAMDDWKWDVYGGTWEAVDCVYCWDDEDFFATDEDDAHTVLVRHQDGDWPPFKNYEVDATVSVGDDDKFAVVFYFKNTSNYYRLEIENEQRKQSFAPYDGTWLYPHSVSLIRRTSGTDTLLATAPWPGTHHFVKPFTTMTFRIKVLTGEHFVYILPQYLNPDVPLKGPPGGASFVNLFDGVITEPKIANWNAGFAGVAARYMGEADLGNADGGRLHRLKVRHIRSFNDIRMLDPGDTSSDAYLLDRQVKPGDATAPFWLYFDQYLAEGETAGSMFWYLDDKTEPFAEKMPRNHSSGDVEEWLTVPDFPPGAHTVWLYDNDTRTGPPLYHYTESELRHFDSKEVWVSSPSAFTIAILPDLHVGQSEDRNRQIEAIMQEVKERTEHDNIRAVIQVGDLAIQGEEDDLAGAAGYFMLLPTDMPVIAAIGNHDHVHYPYGFFRIARRNSRWPDKHIFPVVTDAYVDKDGNSVETTRLKAGYGVETPAEVDNMYFLLDEEDLGVAGSGNWMVMSLQVDPMKKDLYWAEKVMKAYSEHNVVLVVHQFLRESGAIEYEEITHPKFPDYPDPVFADATSAQDFWNFLDKNDQIKIVLDGHTSIQGGLFKKWSDKDWNWESEDKVLALMTDVSYAHTIQGAGGQFRLLEIDPGQGKVRGRLVYARPDYHQIEGAGSSTYLEKQVMNAVHDDTYFVESMKLPPTLNAWNRLLFEDFNHTDHSIDWFLLHCHYEVDDCLPDDWITLETESDWHVDMTNEPDHVDRTSNEETDVARSMAKYGRVREVSGAQQTRLVYQNPDAYGWKDYTLELDMAFGDPSGSMGVLFNHNGDFGYYQFTLLEDDGKLGWSFDKGIDGVGVQHIEGGVTAHDLPVHKPLKVVIDLSQLSRSGKINVQVTDTLADGALIDLTGTKALRDDMDEPFHTMGTIGLYSSTMSGAGAIFDNILVTTDICAAGDNNADTDGDGVLDDCDNCPHTANTDQADCNDNGTGDVCEPHPCNLHPVADAGPDQIFECAANPTTTVQLDGSASFDPDSDDPIAAYLWTGGIFSPSDNAVNPTVELGLGAHVLNLTVFDEFAYEGTDSVEITIEDTVDPVIVAPDDIQVEYTSIPQVIDDLGTPTITEVCGYTVSNNAPPFNWFLLGDTTVTWTVTDSAGNTHSDTQIVTVGNTPPVANDQSVSVLEDSLANPITLTASDINNDAPLTFDLVGGSGPDHGTLGGTAPDLTYTPDADYFGPDSFEFTATDEQDATSMPAMVTITVTPVNDPPVVSISRPTATLQYSDTIGTVSMTATDVDDHPLTLNAAYTDNGGDPITGLPGDLGVAGDCVADDTVPAGTGSSCSWALGGQMREDAGDYNITFTVTDGGGGTDTIQSASGVTELIVNPESATLSFDGSNPVAIQVDGEGSDSSLPFSLTVYIEETEPDLATFDAMFGDLGLAFPQIVLAPIGPGAPQPPLSCDPPAVSGSGYSQEMTLSCHFAGVPVNTYSVDASVNGGHYEGFNDDVITVYDPSLGFTTGGGWFYWPGTEERTNFGYSMKYNKKRTNIKGNLLVIRHIPGAPEDADKWRIKSNALHGLSLGDDGEPVFGWASFSGKATYKAPGVETEGNHEFTVYVEDHGQPGAGADRFWLQVRDKNDDVIGVISMPFPGAGHAVTIEGGNISVPH